MTTFALLLCLAPCQSDNGLMELLRAIEGVPEKQERPQPQSYTAEQIRLLRITQARNSGLQPHATLMASAQAWADWMASNGFVHSSAGWRPNASENIAWNSRFSIDELGTQWTNSSSHNGNWLSNWRYVGVGIAYTGGRIYGVQHFSSNPTATSGVARATAGRRISTTTTRRRWFSRRRR